MRHRLSAASLRLQGPAAAAVVPLCVAPCARRRETSGGPAGRPSDLGAEGHDFFPRRFSVAMRRRLCFAGPSPCSAPVPEPTCMTMVSLLPGSIVTVWFRSRYGVGMTAFIGFGATPPRHHGSVIARARCSLVPLCTAFHVPRTAPGGDPLGRPSDLGPEGRPPFVGRIFRACIQPGTGPVLRPSRHTS